MQRTKAAGHKQHLAASLKPRQGLGGTPGEPGYLPPAYLPAGHGHLSPLRPPAAARVAVPVPVASLPRCPRPGAGPPAPPGGATTASAAAPGGPCPERAGFTASAPFAASPCQPGAPSPEHPPPPPELFPPAPRQHPPLQHVPPRASFSTPAWIPPGASPPRPPSFPSSGCGASFPDATSHPRCFPHGERPLSQRLRNRGEGGG